MKNTMYTLLTTLFCIISFGIFAQEYSIGCRANFENRPSQHFQLSNTSGNINLDNIFNTEVSVLKKFFSVNPSFYFYNDNGSPNAISMPIIENTNFPSGTIIFGKSLLIQEFKTSNSGTTIPIVIAHEFGHIIDYKFKVATNYETKIKELFADFEAGCFLFYRSVLISTDVRAVLLDFYNRGEYEFNNPDHHGTPQERLDALLAGYNWLKNISTPGKYISVESSIKEAKSYLKITSKKSPQKSPQESTTLANINITTHILHPISEENTIIYKYSINVANNNDFNVVVTVSGLSYGHYNNCISETSNFIKDGDFDEKRISVSANSSSTVVLSANIDQNPPLTCGGVNPHQKAKVIRVENEE